MNKNARFAPCRMSMDIFVVEKRQKSTKNIFSKGLDKRLFALYNMRVKQRRASDLTCSQSRSRVNRVQKPALGFWCMPCGEESLYGYFFYPMEVLGISSAKDNKETLLNEDIVAPEIRLIGPEGEALASCRRKRRSLWPTIEEWTL